MLRLRELTKTYKRGQSSWPVLRDVSLSVAAGEFCALTGVSGSGKTTLMNLIGLLDRPTTGNIEIAGRDTSNLSQEETASFRNREIGFVFQAFHLLSRYSVIDNVALPLVYRGIGKTARRNAAEAALLKVGLVDRMNHRPNELSGGQRQRVAIARAIVGTPTLLLADEPTGNLDSQSAEEILSLFFRLSAEFGTTTIIVTHDPGIAARCRRKIVMRDGQIYEDAGHRLLNSELA